jgi:hypothetical protein
VQRRHSKALFSGDKQVSTRRDYLKFTALAGVAGEIVQQMGILKELREEGRVRYIGTTYTGQSRFSDLAAVMRDEQAPPHVG